jgi:hypothetical protein
MISFAILTPLSFHRKEDVTTSFIVLHDEICSDTRQQKKNTTRENVKRNKIENGKRKNNVILI